MVKTKGGLERPAGPDAEDGRPTYIDAAGKRQFLDGSGYVPDPEAADKPTHFSKTDPFGPKEGVSDLPDDTPVKVKTGKKPHVEEVEKTAKQAGEDRRDELAAAKTHREAEEQKRAEAENARQNGDDERAKQLDSEADEHKKQKEQHEQKARENSEALGDAATDHAVKQLYPDKDVTPVKKDRGPNAFDNTYKVDPPPPNYIIAESKGGSGSNSSSRKGR